MNLSPQTLAKIDEVITHYPVKRSAVLMLLHAILKGPVRENQRAIKPVLNAYGLGGGQIRPPRFAISGEELETVLQAIEALQIPEMAGWKR